MKKEDFWSGLFWFAISVFVCLHSYRLGLGVLNNPGAGFAFFWGGVILGGLSLSVLISAIKARTDDRGRGAGQVFGGVRWRRVALTLASAILYGFVLEGLGYLMSTFLLIAFLLYSIGARRWYIVLVVAACSSFLSYALFALWLHTRLPKGIFWI